MKHLLLFCFCLLTMSAMADSIKQSETWVNNKYHLKVNFKFYKHAIKAKNLGRRGWTTFSKIKPGVYDNCRGSRLIVEGPGIIVYDSRVRASNLVFRPIQTSHNYRGGSRGIGLGGTWKVEGLNSTLHVSKFSNGFEARLNGQKKWRRFKQKEQGFFVDSEGNSYTVISDREMLWESRDGRSKFKVIR